MSEEEEKWTRDGQSKELNMSPSCSSFEVLEPHDPVISRLATQLFRKTNDYLQGEMAVSQKSQENWCNSTMIWARYQISPVDHYNLLEEINRLAITKYTDLRNLAVNLSKTLSDYNDIYADQIKPLLHQIDAIDAQVSRFEANAYRLDAYTRQLRARFREVEDKSEYNYKKSATNFLESDEEHERLVQESSTKIKTKGAVKRAPSYVPESDEERERQERPSAKKPKAAPKRQPKAGASQTAASSSRGKRAPENATEWLFGSDVDDSQTPRKVTDHNTSVLTRRVPMGTVRRTAQLDGEYMVEIRLYNHSEVCKLEGLERCEKAVVWLRLQGDGDSVEFNLLKKLLTRAKEKFTEEGTFFLEKKKKT